MREAPHRMDERCISACEWVWLRGLLHGADCIRVWRVGPCGVVWGRVGLCGALWGCVGLCGVVRWKRYFKQKEIKSSHLVVEEMDRVLVQFQRQTLEE